jgi:hypothetical protein
MRPIGKTRIHFRRENTVEQHSALVVLEEHFDAHQTLPPAAPTLFTLSEELRSKPE